MEITRNTLETNPGPSDWFTGSVYIDAFTVPSAASQIGAGAVHFTPGARTAWHRHPHGQTIWVTQGVGLCQREGGPVEVIQPGDRVCFESGENHWHGAAPAASELRREIRSDWPRCRSDLSELVDATTVVVLPAVRGDAAPAVGLAPV